MNIEEYLNKNFPTVELVPSIYSQWDIGIHLSLGGGVYQFKENGELNSELFNTIYKQTLAIYNDLFDQDDNLILVTNIYSQKKRQQIQRMKVYQPNLRDKNNLKKIKVETHPYPFEAEESAKYEMQQFSLNCKVSDIRVDGLLKSAINKDFPPLKPRFGADYVHYPDVFFVNVTKDIIFFVYDDRGCEVIARETDVLRPLYEKYFDWVEEVDREQIEKGLGL